MKDVIVKVLGFYVEYRRHLNQTKAEFWKRIDFEWFHKPLTNDDIMKLVRGYKK